jgi:hypothetical protein
MGNLLTFCPQTVNVNKAIVRSTMKDGRYVRPETKTVVAPPIEWRPDKPAVPRSARTTIDRDPFKTHSPVHCQDEIAWDQEDAFPLFGRTYGGL